MPHDVRDMPEVRGKRQFRMATVQRDTLDAETRTVELAFASEYPVERWWGIEILGLRAGEMSTDWIGSGSAPLLMDHDPKDQIGVVESVTLGADRKARAVVRFSRSARAQEVMQDVADGIRTSISVGYEINDLQLESEAGGVATYRAVRWNPLEVSIVSVPADPTVGVGREADDPRSQKPATVRENPMPDPTIPATPAAPAAPPPPREPTADEIAAASRRYTDEIMALGTIANARDLAVEAIGKGLTVEQFRGQLVEARRSNTPLGAPPTEIGMTQKEVQRFSLARYILSRADNNPALAPFENEAALAATQKLEKAGYRASKGPVLPYDVMAAPVPGLRMADGRVVAGQGSYQRDLTVGVTTAGGYTVATDLLASSFIDLLRNAMQVRAMGATVLGGLVGNIAIPRQAGTAGANWVAEGVAAAESNASFGQVTMTPKTIHAIQDYTRDLLLQSSLDVEAFVRADLAIVLALGIDLAALHGTGTASQPTGLANTAGIGSVAGGTNGAVPTWDNIVDLETGVANLNAAIGSLGYLTNSKIRGTLKKTTKVAGYPVYLWEPPAVPVDAQAGIGSLNGYRAAVSNQVRGDLTKGTATNANAIFFGNWADLMIGEWGAVETLVDNITQASNRIIRVHAYETVDVAVRRPQSFAAMLDALAA